MVKYQLLKVRQTLNPSRQIIHGNVRQHHRDNGSKVFAVMLSLVLILLVSLFKTTNGLFSSASTTSTSQSQSQSQQQTTKHIFPHSHTYKAHAWDEYNLGPITNINVVLSGGGTSSTTTTTEQTGEPSHILLCRSLLQQEHELSSSSQGGNESEGEAFRSSSSSTSSEGSITVIDEEDSKVCRNGRNPYKSLMIMFTSSLITHVSHVLMGRRHLSAKLFYEHSCGVNMALQEQQEEVSSGSTSFSSIEEKWINDSTIQQLMPPFLKMGFNQIQEEILVPKILNKCQICVEEYELHKQQYGSLDALEHKRFPSCILQSSDSSSTTATTTTATTTTQEAYQDPLLRQRRTLLRHGSGSSSTTTTTTTTNRILQEEQIEEDEDYDLKHNMHIDIDILKSLIPCFKNNLRQAAEEWTSLRHVVLNKQTFDAAGGGSGGGGNIVRGSKAFTEQRHKGMIIYIDCIHGDCLESNAKSLALPLWVYASEIPRNIHAIEIIVSHTCATDIGGCGTHALKLKDFLIQYIPTTNAITLEQHSTSSNTGSLYARMILTGHLLGPPSLTTVLPMLSSSYKSTFISNKTLYPWMDTLLKLQQTNQLSYGQSIQGIKSYYSSDVAVVPYLKSPFHIEQLDDILNIPITDDPILKSIKCKNIRGRLGQWMLGSTDEEIYNLQYKTNPILGYAGNADTAWYPMYNEFSGNAGIYAKRGSIEGPHRNATKYIWNDYFQDSCPIDQMTIDNLCTTLHNLSIKRVMFLGDSLQFHWSQGFWKLLNQLDTPGSDTSLQWELTLHCPFSSSEEDKTTNSMPPPSPALSDPGQIQYEQEQLSTTNEIQFTFIRNDHLNNISDEIEYGIPNCGNFSYCTSWQDYYTNDSRNTLLIANTGPHQYHPEEYESDLKGFLSFIEQQHQQRSNDIIYIRNTVPGHPGCQTITEPFQNFEQVKENADYTQEPYKYFNWHLFPSYNNYLDELVRSIKEHGGSTGVPSTISTNATISEATASLWQIDNNDNDNNNKGLNIELLDVYEMTSLRGDGHISSNENHVMEFLQSDKCHNCIVPKKIWNNDCLHYSLPGPIDWWSHLLYSNLNDMAQYKQLKEQQQKRRW